MKKGRANFFLTIIAIIFMLVGIAVFFMPNFLNWLYNKKVVKIKQDFTTVVTSENNKTKYKGKMKVYMKINKRN